MFLQACDLIGAEQPEGREAAATSWAAVRQYGNAKLGYPSHMPGADDSAYGHNLRSGRIDRNTSFSREPNLLDIGEESTALLSADARLHEAGDADGRSSNGAIARDPFEGLVA